MKRLSVILIFILFGLNVYAEKEYNFKAKTSENAALRSLMLSGWGQYFNNQKAKSFILGGITYSSFISATTFYFLAQKDYSDYEKKSVVDDPLYDSYKKKIIYSNVFLGIGLASWTYSIIDAYITGGKRAEIYSMTEQDVNIMVYKENISIKYNYKF